MQQAETQFRVTKQDDGSVLLEHTGGDNFTLSADEAYALLDFLYKERDNLASAVHGQETGHVVHEFERADSLDDEGKAVEGNQFPSVASTEGNEKPIS